MNRKMCALAGLALALAMTTSASAAGFFTNGVPPAGGTQYPSTLPLTGNETIPADTNLPSGLNPASEAITTTQLAGFGATQPGSGGWRNALVGGDFGTNLWQRGTTSASVTTALAYTADRWWGLSGTGTAFTVIKETAAADITSGYAASARVQRTAAQTGILPVCVGQVLTSANSTRFQGRLAEFSFHALPGANFSAAGGQVTATIATGTGSDDTAANFSTGTWAGYVASSTVVTLGSAWDRYSVVATIPQTATQIGVKICYTPVGTAGTNDWFEFAGAQLDVNQAADAKVASGDGLAYNIASFERRPASIEASLQYVYFYRLAEPASGAAIPAMCQATGATTNICNVFLPNVMRATVPTIAITTAGTFKVNIAGTPTTIATPTASTCSSNSCAVTAANTNTAGQAELLSGGGGTGAWDVSAEL